MTKSQTSMRTEDGIKYKGIHEPSGRVKGYRVEIRPPNSKRKIWVGTFETRLKAMRAFDAAVYLTGKEPYYYVYPAYYFPTKPPGMALRDFVQAEAKKFADRTDDLKVNPSSFLVDPPKAAPVVKEAPPDLFAWLDEDLRDASYPCVDPILLPFPGNAWNFPLEVEPPPIEEERKGGAEDAAFDKGYYRPDLGFISALLDQEPPGDFLPSIDGEHPPVYSPSRPSSKRKRLSTTSFPDVDDENPSSFWKGILNQTPDRPFANDPLYPFWEFLCDSACCDKCEGL